MKRWTCALCHHADVPHKRRDICDDCQASLDVRGLAWCTACRKRKRMDEMARYGKDTRCKACKNAEQRARYEPGQQANRSRAWRARNKERIQAYKRRPDVRARERDIARRAYHANPEHYRSRRLACYYANRDLEIQRQRERRRANPEQSRAINRQSKMRRKLRILHSWKQAVESQRQKAG